MVVDSIKEYLKKKEKKVFDLREFMLEKHYIPEAEEINEYDYLMSCEPTNCWVGEAIRKEMFYMNGRDYSENLMLKAFSLDRLLLFKRLIVPFLERGGNVFQERSISTTLIQQPVHDPRITISRILKESGHDYILQHLPDYLVIINVDPEKTIQWIEKREKKDNDMYEKLMLQKQFAKRYNSKWFKKIFKERGTEVLFIDNNSTEKDLIAKSIYLMKSLRRLK